MEFLETITLRQILGFIASSTALLSVVMEFSKKIPFNPWSFIFTQLGKALNKDINAKLDELDIQQKANSEAIRKLEQVVEEKFSEKQKDDDEKEAKRLRSHIIEFADSCRVGNKHTQTHFKNVMKDYGDYENYCKKHNIPNHYIDIDYAYIEEVYSRCLKDNDFL